MTEVQTEGDHRLPEVSDGQVRECLERICASSEFAQAPRMQAFLRFVVDETLAGRRDRLKAYTIGVQVYGREASFDPGTDPIVRVDARRLRQKLVDYYATEGATDRVRIELPKGGYAVDFSSPAPARTALPLDVPSGPVVAVLPFVDMSRGADQLHFAEGITEEIITQLSRFRELFVIARSTMFQYRDQAVDVRTLAADLGADYVLEGSVRVSGAAGAEQIRVTAQLLEGQRGTHVWAENYTHELTPERLFELQDDISSRMVSAIAGAHGQLDLSEGPRRRRAGTLDAYSLVLRFNRYMRDLEPADRDVLLADLEASVEAEPEFAETAAVLSLMHQEIWAFDWTLRDRWPWHRERAAELANRAVAVDPQLARGHLARFAAAFSAGNMAEFRVSLHRSLELNPNMIDLLAEGAMRLACLGEEQAALAMYEKCRVLNPNHPRWFHVVPTVAHLSAGRFEAARDEAVMIDEDFYWGHALQAVAHSLCEEHELAAAARERMHQIYPDFVADLEVQLDKWSFSEGLRGAFTGGLCPPVPPARRDR